MPPKHKFTKEEILASALELARKEGINAVTARRVGAALGASSKVIFSLFQNMEELQQGVRQQAEALYQHYLVEEMTTGRYSPYKGSGMGYIRFAREEQELFRLLFMENRAGSLSAEGSEVRELIALLQSKLGLSEEQARRFHLEMWLYVHGIATMIATGYLTFDTAQIDQLLTDAYLGLRTRYTTDATRAEGEENRA
jgi:AcrR family transcriptional regulator